VFAGDGVQGLGFLPQRAIGGNRASAQQDVGVVVAVVGVQIDTYQCVGE